MKEFGKNKPPDQTCVRRGVVFVRVHLAVGATVPLGVRRSWAQALSGRSGIAPGRMPTDGISGGERDDQDEVEPDSRPRPAPSAIIEVEHIMDLKPPPTAMVEPRAPTPWIELV